MKKSVIALAMAFGVSSAFAQDLTSKKGEPILPEAGDWAISADATPFLNYMGNFFGKTSNNTAPTFNFLTGNSVIVGKYFADEKTAYRGGLNIGFNTQSSSNLVDQDHVGTPKPGNDPTKVTDKQTTSTMGIGLTGGIEKRKGKTRLQGYYGAELAFYIGSSTTKTKYGNAISDSAGYGNATSTTAFSPAGSTTNTATSGLVNSRVTEVKGGTNFQFGVRGFIGVEYFVLPKISLGGEFGWGIGISTWGAGTTTSEASYLKPNAPAAIPYSTYNTVTTAPGKSSAFVIGADNKNSIFGPVGSIRMNFYF
ncbi:MAG TPA: hypothetical protein VF411_08525 [Bacteroidia bacterium]